MRGNPYGSLSSARRFATGLLSFRYTVWDYLSSYYGLRLGDIKGIVAAGMNPAAKETPVKEMPVQA